MRAVTEDVEGKRSITTTKKEFLTMNQLFHRSERHQAEKRGPRLQVHRALKKALTFSRKIALHKRIAMMLSTEDIPGLRHIFARALQTGASIHTLLDQLTRAVKGDYKARGYDDRSIELATVVMRLGDPALLKVLHTAGDMPSVNIVQSRLQKSTVSHTTPV